MLSAVKNIKNYAALALLVIHATGYSQSVREKKSHANLDKSGLAISGYDPVSYFLRSEPVEGKRDHAIKIDGATYYFESAANLELFRKNPQKYQPQYGGWCAYAMGETGEKVEVDPETFKIIDGKLCLFYNKILQ